MACTRPHASTTIYLSFVGTDVGEDFVRKIGRLSALAVSKTREPGMYPDGAGLYLQVRASDARSWIYRFMLNGRARSMGLGPLHTICLAEARAKALECRKLCLDGIDPIEHRGRARAAHRIEAARGITFDACAEAYVQAHKSGWKNKRHTSQWSTSLAAYVSPVFGSLPVQAVDVGLVMQVLEPIWITKTETAYRLRGRIEAVLDWAATRGYRQGENPARWRGHLQNLLPRRSKVRRVEHFAALPFSEVPSFMETLSGMKGTAPLALRFAVLTATRTSEVAGARWDEIDEAERSWTIPAERMKADREHRVPLSGAALAVLERMKPTNSPYVFSGRRQSQPLSATAMLKVIERMGQSDATTHGFRSSFRDWASETTNFPSEVIEMALAHAISDKVEAAYRRGDLFHKRRQLMEAWTEFCFLPDRS